MINWLIQCNPLQGYQQERLADFIPQLDDDGMGEVCYLQQRCLRSCESYFCKPFSGPI